MQPMLNQFLNVLFDGGRGYGESGCHFIEKKKIIPLYLLYSIIAQYFSQKQDWEQTRQF